MEVKCVYREINRQTEIFICSRGFQQRAGYLHKHIGLCPQVMCGSSAPTLYTVPNPQADQVCTRLSHVQ